MKMFKVLHDNFKFFYRYLNKENKQKFSSKRKGKIWRLIFFTILRIQITLFLMTNKKNNWLSHLQQLWVFHPINLFVIFTLDGRNFRYFQFLKFIQKYSQTCVQRPHLGPEKSGRLTEVSDKIDIYTGRWWLKLAVVNRWPLFTGGR